MIYLNVAGLSPFNQTVQEEVTSTLKQFSELLYSEEGIHYYRETVQRCRQDLAQYLRIENAEGIAFVPNTTTATWLVLSRIHWRSGDHILTTTHENSTVLKEILNLHIHGVQVHTLDPKSPTALETEIERLLMSTQVRAIVISHVSHVDGRIFPLERLTQLAHTHQAFLIIDGAQAIGHIPVTFQNWQPDAYFFPGHKWCAGPMGTGVLILGKHLGGFDDNDSHQGNEPRQPAWAKFELGTQNIGLIAGLTKACILKQQEERQLTFHEKAREEWKTCLQKHRGIQIWEWAGPHSPGILSFTCLDGETKLFLQRIARTHALSWKSFAHPSFPGNFSVRISWFTHISKQELSSVLAFFTSM